MPSPSSTLHTKQMTARAFVVLLISSLSLMVPCKSLAIRREFSNSNQDPLLEHGPKRKQPALKKATNKQVTVTDIGPELGISYGIEGFVINPLDHKQILLPSQNGLFKSNDAGTSWRRVRIEPDTPALELIASVRLDPRTPGTVYAITNNPGIFGWGLFKSNDFGESWHILLGLPDALADCAPHQTAPNVVFALQRTAQSHFNVDAPGSALLKANDGVSFEYQIGTGLPEIIFDPESEDQLSNPIFTSMAMSPQPNVMFVANLDDTLGYYAGGGVYKSADGGQNFTRLENSPLQPLQVFPHPTQPNTIFVQAQGGDWITGIFKSTDGGLTFEEVTDGLPAGKFNFYVGFDPTHPSVVYVAGEGGLFRSTNGGLTFAPTGLTKSQTGVGASTLTVDTQNSNLVYVNTSSGNFKSTNGGTDFFQINHGWTAASVTDITFDNSSQPTLYLSTQLGTGLFKTRTRGKYYERLAEPIEQSVFATSWISALAVAPSNPNFIVALSRAHGVFRSLDGGSTWSASEIDTNQQRFTTFSSEVSIDPTNPNNVYIGCGNAPNPGFYKSNDGAETFTRTFFFPSSVLASVFTVLALEPTNPQNIYTGSAVPQPNGTLLKSVNGGEDFSPTIIAPEAAITDLLVDPLNPNNIYIAGVFLFEEEEHVVLRSPDGGETFIPADNGLGGNFIGFAIDPINPARLFAWTTDGLFISENSGTDWTLLEGDETARRGRDFGTSIVVNPKNPNLIYLAGASVLEVEIK